jgi:tetratricopeptide (TPR) repeat protein
VKSPAKHLIAMLMLPLANVVPASAQGPALKNMELCNGADSTPSDVQIKGCTTLIASGDLTPQGLAKAYNNRGNHYSRKGEYDRAIQDYNQSIKSNPNYPNAFNNRGAAYQKQGDYERAIKDFDEAIKLKPDYSIALANRAEAYGNNAEYDRAKEDYDAAIRLQPTLQDVWSGRCWIRAALGELERALSDCNEALRLQPNAAATTFESRGFTYLKMGQWDSAITDYNSALRLDPRLAKSLYGRGLAELKKGNVTAGKADLAAARAIEARIADYFRRYGVQ